jgi:hypothetical protein
VSKRIALKDFIEVDSTDLSDFARSVDFKSDHAKTDVSGFSATGFNEYLAGSTDQEVTVEFYGSYDTDEVHQTLYPLHQSRAIVAFKWRHDQTNPVAATNPQLEGNVQILTYEPGAKRGDAEAFNVTFTAIDAAGLAFVTVDAG